MNSESKLIKTKLGLLNLAEHLGNVSKACKLMGYSRDSFYRIKDLFGRIYQQTVIDTYTRVCFTKLYDNKHAITAADTLNDRVIPFFEEQQIPVLRILTDRGTEYNGKVEHGHDYQLYLTIEGIDHSRTKVRHPQSNGICERFHRTIQEEFYSTAFRKKIYNTLKDLQTDLDNWMQYYNNERSHSGRYCYGKTPMHTMEESLSLAKQKLLNQTDPAA